MLDVPTGPVELHSEIIQQLRMDRGLSLSAEVIETLGNPGPEYEVPEPVDHDSGGQSPGPRCRVSQPVCEVKTSQPASLCGLSGFPEKRWERGFYYRAAVVEPVSPWQDANDPWLGSNCNHGPPSLFLKYCKFHLEGFLLLLGGKGPGIQFAFELREAHTLPL